MMSNLEIKALLPLFKKVVQLMEKDTVPEHVLREDQIRKNLTRKIGKEAAKVARNKNLSQSGKPIEIKRSDIHKLKNLFKELQHEDKEIYDKRLEKYEEKDSILELEQQMLQDMGLGATEVSVDLRKEQRRNQKEMDGLKELKNKGVYTELTKAMNILEKSERSIESSTKNKQQSKQKPRLKAAC